MNTKIAQILTLIAYGNAYLNNQYTLDNILLSSQQFKFCQQVQFKERQSDANEEIIVSNDPDTWMELIKAKECLSLRLKYYPNKKAKPADICSDFAFVGGGGFWPILCLYSDKIEYWIGNWQVTNRGDKNRRIWTVAYYRTVKHSPCPMMSLELKLSRDRLNSALCAIELYARKNNLRTYADIFSKAIYTMNSVNPEESLPEYLKGIIPLNLYSLEAKQLLFAACNSFVFGGMGSWNDTPSDDKEEYINVSNALYYAMNEAFTTAINTYP